MAGELQRRAGFRAVADATQTSAAMTENSTTVGGTNDGNVATLAMSVTWNGSSVYPSAADAALIISGIRECMAMVNKLVADVAVLTAQINGTA